MITTGQLPLIPTAVLDLTDYDIILINTSAGKDSQVLMDVVYHAAREAGVAHRVVAVHADLGRVEWPGTPELAEEHAAHYGIRFVKVSRPQGDLLQQVRDRRVTLDRQSAAAAAAGDTAKAVEKWNAPAWPSSTTRYCTSDQKRGQVRKIMTMLVDELHLRRPARVLNCMGFRREESPARAKKVAFRYDPSASGEGMVRRVHEWLPILEWSVGDVWERIEAAGTRPHPAYASGMPRLSCCFCVLASKGALVRAAQLMPDLAAEYQQVEIEVRSRFKKELSMAEIIADAERALEPVAIENWNA